jgi:hypothetical protein
MKKEFTQKYLCDDEGILFKSKGGAIAHKSTYRGHRIKVIEVRETNLEIGF